MTTETKYVATSALETAGPKTKTTKHVEID